MTTNTARAYAAAACFGGAAYCLLVSRRRRTLCIECTEEVTAEHARGLVWGSIAGAMTAAQIYIGDHLGLYAACRELSSVGRSWTVIELAEKTGCKVRWLREWCAQQAASGILVLEDGLGDDDKSLRYRLPPAFGEVLANPASPNYDVSMIQAVPSLVYRAKVNAPAWFKTGTGSTYDLQDVTDATDRQHAVHVRDVVLPRLLPAARGVLAALERGVRVAEVWRPAAPNPRPQQSSAWHSSAAHVRIGAPHRRSSAAGAATCSSPSARASRALTSTGTK